MLHLSSPDVKVHRRVLKITVCGPVLRGCVLSCFNHGWICISKDCSPPGSSVQGIIQARTLEWVVIFFSRGSSRPRDPTHVSCIAGGFFTDWTTREASKPPLNGIYFFNTSCFLSAKAYPTVFATQWTVTPHDPLSVGFPRQEYWSGLACLLPGDFPGPGIRPASSVSPALQVTLSHLGSPVDLFWLTVNFCIVHNQEDFSYFKRDIGTREGGIHDTDYVWSPKPEIFTLCPFVDYTCWFLVYRIDIEVCSAHLCSFIRSPWCLNISYFPLKLLLPLDFPFKSLFVFDTCLPVSVFKWYELFLVG